MPHESAPASITDPSELRRLRSRLDALERRASRAGRGRPGAFLLGIAILLPTLAWTASVPHPAFEGGAPISASEMNANFGALVEQLTVVEAESHGAIAMSEVAGFSTTTSEVTPVPELGVALETHGGLVRLELAPAPGAGSRLWVIGAGGGADPWLFARVGFERSSDGLAFEEICELGFGGSPDAVGSTVVPPGAFTCYDDPAAGEWVYRVTLEEKSNAGEMTIVVDNVRLVAREIGSAPT